MRKIKFILFILLSVIVVSFLSVHSVYAAGNDPYFSNMHFQFYKYILNIFNSLVGLFMGIGSRASIVGVYVASILAIISFSELTYKYFLDKQDNYLQEFFKKLIIYTFLILVINYATTLFLLGFHLTVLFTGMFIGSSSNNWATVVNPLFALNSAFNIVTLYWKLLAFVSGGGLFHILNLYDLAFVLVSGICLLIILMSAVMIAIAFYTAVLELFVLFYMGVFLLGFYIFSGTKQIATSYLSAILKGYVKYLVIAVSIFFANTIIVSAVGLMMNMTSCYPNNNGYAGNFLGNLGSGIKNVLAGFVGDIVTIGEAISGGSTTVSLEASHLAVTDALNNFKASVMTPVSTCASKIFSPGIVSGAAGHNAVQAMLIFIAITIVFVIAGLLVSKVPAIINGAMSGSFGSLKPSHITAPAIMAGSMAAGAGMAAVGAVTGGVAGAVGGVANGGKGAVNKASNAGGGGGGEDAGGGGDGKGGSTGVGKAITKASNAAGDATEKGTAAAGKGLKGAGSALDAIPYVGPVLGAAAKTAGSAVEVGGKAAGKAVKATGKVAGKVADAGVNTAKKVASRSGGSGGGNSGGGSSSSSGGGSGRIAGGVAGGISGVAGGVSKATGSTVNSAKNYASQSTNSMD